MLRPHMARRQIRLHKVEPLETADLDELDEVF